MELRAQLAEEPEPLTAEDLNVAGAMAVLMKDATCPALLAGLVAAQKGAPFMPIRGIIGSDLLRARPDWKVIENPFAPDDPIVAINPLGT